MIHFKDALFNRYFKLDFAVVLLLCSATSAQALPQVAVQSDVASCRFLSWVSGNSGYGKNNDWKGSAKMDALKRAELMGASHVVVGNFQSLGAFNGTVNGKLYVCDSRVKPLQAQNNSQNLTGGLGNEAE